MGFFLSKLLPQLIYPLGLGLLLQLIAIGGRKRRWALPLSITGWLVIAVPAMPVVSDALLRQLEDQAAALTPKTIPQGGCGVGAWRGHPSGSSQGPGCGSE